MHSQYATGSRVSCGANSGIDSVSEHGHSCLTHVMLIFRSASFDIRSNLPHPSFVLLHLLDDQNLL